MGYSPWGCKEWGTTEQLHSMSMRRSELESISQTSSPWKTDPPDPDHSLEGPRMPPQLPKCPLGAGQPTEG